MEEKILPTVVPPIITYPPINAALSIALTRQEVWPWFFNKFVQIYGVKEYVFSLNGNFIDGDISPASCPYISRVALKRDYVNRNFRSFIDFAINTLDSDYYPYVFLDRYYNEHSENYQKDHFAHQMFINGYDKNKQVFIGADFFNGEYQFKKISFDAIEKGFQNFDKTLPDNEFCKYPEVVMYCYKEATWKFNFEVLITSLEDYLYERDSTNVFYYWFPHEIQNKLQYGLAYYDTLFMLLNDGTSDYRIFHILYERKKVMNMRLAFLQEEFGYNNVKVFEIYKELENKALITRNLILKCIQKDSMNAQTVGKIEKIITSIRDMERSILPILIDDLKKLSRCHVG